MATQNKTVKCQRLFLMQRIIAAHQVAIQHSSTLYYSENVNIQLHNVKCNLMSVATSYKSIKCKVRRSPLPRRVTVKLGHSRKKKLKHAGKEQKKAFTTCRFCNVVLKYSSYTLSLCTRHKTVSKESIYVLHFFFCLFIGL